MSLTEARSEPLSSSQPPLVAVRDYVRPVAIAAFWAIFLLALLNRGATEIESRIVVTAGIYLLLVPSILLFGPPKAGAGKVLAAACLLLGALIVQVLLQTSSIPGIARLNPAWSTAAMFMQTAPAATISLTPADDRLGVMSAAVPFGAERNGMILYTRTIAVCEGSQFASFDYEYPKTALKDADAVVDRLVRSFRETEAGAGC